jgi:hypothetical protein
LADRFGWHEAGPAHAALDHLGQPHRVQLVGLGSAGHILDVLGVEQPALEAFGLQQVERRLLVSMERPAPVRIYVGHPH